MPARIGAGQLASTRRWRHDTMPGSQASLERGERASPAVAHRKILLREPEHAKKRADVQTT
eukprot:265597-Chlamydomonas_euryale.AAC.5